MIGSSHTSRTPAVETTTTLSRDRSIITERIIVLRAPIIGAPAGAVHTREVS